MQSWLAEETPNQQDAGLVCEPIKFKLDLIGSHTKTDMVNMNLSLYDFSYVVIVEK